MIPVVFSPFSPRSPQWHQLGIAFAPARSHGESRPVLAAGSFSFESGLLLRFSKTG